MAEFSSHAPGTFSWTELSTSDRKAGVAFYGALFGWESNDLPTGPGPDDVYTMLGASVMVGPHDIPSTGRFAILQDPQSAMFAVFQFKG